MGKKVDCSCGGSNENCALCGGLGEYTTGSSGYWMGTPKRKRKFKQDVRPDLLPLIEKSGCSEEKADAQAESAVRVDGQKATCHYQKCGFTGSRDEVYRHVQSNHPPSERASSERTNGSVCRDRMQCPLCDEHLYRAEFLIHLRDKHRTTWAALEQIMQSTSARNLSGAESSYKVKCILCTADVPLRETDFHLKFQHATEIEHLRRLARKEGHKAGNPSHEKCPLSKGVVERTRQDTLEAHRYMGFVARENGRYGSHPLHDKHDDESMP